MARNAIDHERENIIRKLQQVTAILNENPDPMEGPLAVEMDFADTTRSPWVRLPLSNDALWYSPMLGFMWGFSYQHTAKNADECAAKILQGLTGDIPADNARSQEEPDASV